jgi:hypothetical protein
VTRYYVYQHTRAGTPDVFYVGKGSGLTDSRAHERRSGRSRWWRRIVEKHGHDVLVVGEFEDEETAFAVEIALIAHYGKGRLCNLADGGQGSRGAVVSEETRSKLRDKLGGVRHPNWGKRLSAETCRRKSESMRRSPLNLRGKTLPAEWRERIRVAKLGARNPMFGRTGSAHPRARSVVDTLTGKRYPSVTAAALALGVPMKSLHNQLSGHRENRTSARWADGM